MSMSIVTFRRPGTGSLCAALSGYDPLIGEVIGVSSPDELLAATTAQHRVCALITVSEDDDLGLVDGLVALDVDAIIMVAVPAGDHARGLDALRRGAHDYVEVDQDGVLEPAAFFTRLHATIARTGVVIQHLREHRRMSKVLEHSAEGYMVVDPAGMVLASSPSLAVIWPDGFHDLDTIFEALHPDDRAHAQELGVQALANPGQAAIGEVRAVDRRGVERWFEIRLNDQSDDPAIGGLIANVRDISDRMLSEREQRRAEARFRLGFENAPSGMAICAVDGTLIQVNEALGRFLACTPDDLVGRHLDELIHPDSLPLNPSMQRLLNHEIHSFQVERSFVRPDGHQAWAILTMVEVPATDGGQGYLLAQFQDITDQKRSADALAHQASHDDLTSLPNRSLLEERLAQALDDAIAPTVLFLGLDNFKVINDGLGHATGDEILIEVANRLYRNVRPADTAARFSGDEFAVVLRGVPTDEAAVARAEHLLSVISEPMRIAGETHFITASIGVARGTAEATAETIMRDADAAMYQAKALGRGRVERFQASLHTRAEHRLRTATRMRQALEAGHFHVAYQPFVAVADERVIGMEALLRWNDPELGPISPGEFIPVAEQTGLIVKLGSWALDEALRQLRQWQDQEPWGHGLVLSVNLSARQLSDHGLVDAVHASITEAGVDTGALCLEITETAVMDDIEASIGIMRMMRSLGVNLSIDDFGTGYSSLNYLKSLPLTTLKVDRSFIDGLGHDTHDTSIVEAVVALGHALDMRVHAEGVERADQLAELRRIGCDDAQGWHWAPAMAADDFAAWMDERGEGRDAEATDDR